MEVLEPQSHEFLASLSHVDTIDDVLQRHEQFLEKCLKEVLLTEHDNLYKHLSKVLQRLFRNWNHRWVGSNHHVSSCFRHFP